MGRVSEREEKTREETVQERGLGTKRPGESQEIKRLLTKMTAIYRGQLLGKREGQPPGEGALVPGGVRNAEGSHTY